MEVTNIRGVKIFIPKWNITQISGSTESNDYCYILLKDGSKICCNETFNTIVNLYKKTEG